MSLYTSSQDPSNLNALPLEYGFDKLDIFHWATDIDETARVSVITKA